MDNKTLIPIDFNSLHTIIGGVVELSDYYINYAFNGTELLPYDGMRITLFDSPGGEAKEIICIDGILKKRNHNLGRWYFRREGEIYYSYKNPMRYVNNLIGAKTHIMKSSDIQELYEELAEKGNDLRSWNQSEDILEGISCIIIAEGKGLYCEINGFTFEQLAKLFGIKSGDIGTYGCTTLGDIRKLGLLNEIPLSKLEEDSSLLAGTAFGIDTFEKISKGNSQGKTIGVRNYRSSIHYFYKIDIDTDKGMGEFLEEVRHWWSDITNYGLQYLQEIGYDTIADRVGDRYQGEGNFTYSRDDILDFLNSLQSYQSQEVISKCKNDTINCEPDHLSDDKKCKSFCSHSEGGHLLLGPGSPPYKGIMVCPVKECECFSTWNIDNEMLKALRRGNSDPYKTTSPPPTSSPTTGEK